LLNIIKIDIIKNVNEVKMRFLGNKTRLLYKIKEVINENIKDSKVLIDLFAGSGSVGDYFKDEFKIISNDILNSMYVINLAKINNSQVPIFLGFEKKFNNDPFKFFNEKVYKIRKTFFITNNYSELANRRFFTTKNSLKIDGIRQDLEIMYKEKTINLNEYYFLLASLIESVMRFSNTTGTYEAFLKKWDKRALKEFKLLPLEIEAKKLKTANEIFNEDANNLIRKITGDILYLDPPYTITDYNNAYHLLETIAKYDSPNIKGITGRRIHKIEKSKYTLSTSAFKNLEDILRQAQVNHVLLSYSSQGLIKIEDLIDLCKKFSKDGKVKIYKVPFREYKNIRSTNKKNNLEEVIIYFEKFTDKIKSPLNYTGSKIEILDSIINILPKHIDIFIDAMGGAFNVGANIIATKEVVYQEYLPHIFDLINYLLDKNKKQIINVVKHRIDELEMNKSNKESYYKLREKYNQEKLISDLFILHCYCFQNQIRFNSKNDFNTPIGNSSFNNNTINKIINFSPKTKNITLVKQSYEVFDLRKVTKDSLFYFDPPYLITSAAYNDGKRGFKGWDDDQEQKLLKYLDKLNALGYKFILSNVLSHKGRTNLLLKNWLSSNSFNITEVGKAGSKNPRTEILISNFDWRTT
jgi:adenine-specific DNA-methyltransferase